LLYPALNLLTRNRRQDPRVCCQFVWIPQQEIVELERLLVVFIEDAETLANLLDDALLADKRIALGLRVFLE
jgi:hypothetical protein